MLYMYVGYIYLKNRKNSILINVYNVYILNNFSLKIMDLQEFTWDAFYRQY